MRIIKYVLPALVVTVAIVMHSCVTFRMSSREIDDYIRINKIDGAQYKYNTGSRVINYVTAGDSTKPLVLFIHGSPGSLSAFIHFLKDSTLTERAFLITTDRPGFGHSNFGWGEGSLAKQSEALKPILARYKGSRPIILVGHSLGGPLIVKMAMDYPELVDGLIIVAGSVDPKLEPNETWFRAPLATPFLSWILPRSLRASNEEIYHLKPELQKLLPYWKDIRCPVIVIQGQKDSLVPKENVDFIRKMLVNAPVEYVLVDEMDHFVPWSNPELIHDAIIKLLNRF